MMNILSTKRCYIGEGPIWNEFDGKLYQVNGMENEIFSIDMKTKELAVKKYDFSTAAMAFTKTGRMIISCMDGVFYLNPDDTREPLYDISKYEIKYGNDAKVGPDGRLYVGTQSSKRVGVSDIADGKLYSIDEQGNVKIVLDNLLLSNGFDWSMDGKRLYHTDSDTRIVKEYDFDAKTGEISFTGRQIHIDGVDGITIDTEDNLYVACWGFSHIAVVDTKTMEVKEYIETPAKVPPSCCFAGENMDKFIVVTATRGTDVEIDENAGYTLEFDIAKKGRKPFLFGEK